MPANTTLVPLCLLFPWTSQSELLKTRIQNCCLTFQFCAQSNSIFPMYFVK